jgi:hypothetical protein
MLHAAETKAAVALVVARVGHHKAVVVTKAVVATKGKGVSATTEAVIKALATKEIKAVATKATKGPVMVGIMVAEAKAVAAKAAATKVKAVEVKVAAATMVAATAVVGVIPAFAAKSAASGDMKPCPVAIILIRCTRLMTLAPATPPPPAKVILHTG